MFFSYLPSIFRFNLLNLYAVVYTNNKKHHRFRYSFPTLDYNFLKLNSKKDKKKKFKYYFDIFHNIIFYGGYKYLPDLIKNTTFFPYRSFFIKIHNKEKIVKTDEFPMFLIFYSFFLHEEFLKKQNELKEVHKKEHISEEEKTIEENNRTDEEYTESSSLVYTFDYNACDTVLRKKTDEEAEINRKKKEQDSFVKCEICSKSVDVWEFSIDVEEIQNLKTKKVEIPELALQIDEIKDQLNKILHQILKTKSSAIVEASRTVPKAEKKNKSNEQLIYKLGVTLPILKEIRKAGQLNKKPDMDSVSSESESEEWSLLSALCLSTQEKKEKETYLKLNLDVKRIDIFFIITSKFLFDRTVMRNILNDRVIDKRFFKGLNGLVNDLFYWRVSKVVILFGWNFYLNPHWKPYFFVKKSYGPRRSLSGLVFDIYDINCLLRQFGIEIDFNLFSYYTSIYLDTRLIDNKLVKLNKTFEKDKIHDMMESALFCENLAELCYIIIHLYFWDSSLKFLSTFTVSSGGFGDDSLIFINRLLSLIKPGNKLYYSGWYTDNFDDELNRMWKKIEDMKEKKKNEK